MARPASRPADMIERRGGLHCKAQHDLLDLLEISICDYDDDGAVNDVTCDVTRDVIDVSRVYGPIRTVARQS